MAGFEVIYGQLVALKITGVIWADGSFFTNKLNPEDIDFILALPVALYDAGTPDQKAFIDWLINNEDDPKKSFRCHTDVVLVYDVAHPSYRSLTEDTLRHWEENIFGYSVADRTPKGIVVVNLPNPPAPEVSAA